VDSPSKFFAQELVIIDASQADHVKLPAGFAYFEFVAVFKRYGDLAVKRKADVVTAASLRGNRDFYLTVVWNNYEQSGRPPKENAP
jgi:hypothetical protein